MQIESLATLAPERKNALLNRGRARLNDLGSVVEPIIERVRAEGDTALLDYTQQFDHVTPLQLALFQEAYTTAAQAVPPALLRSLRKAAAAIAAFHQAQLPTKTEPVVETVPGVRVWRVWRSIERVGIYVPGGLARYPSSLLMAAIPAHVAGCTEIIVCTPPGPDGRVPNDILTAAYCAGVTRVCAVGGAQAIAALAYGTESVPRVDKILGPGSSYVAAAKMRVSADVAIDMPAGPSEIMILADATADPAWVAADLLAQAEHGPESACILVTSERRLAEQVQAAIETQLPTLPTAVTIRMSLANQGALLVAETIAEAAAFVNAYAPEHLAIITRDPAAVLPDIQHAGSVFLGNWSPVAAGDYATGGNHTLPTAGFARGYAPLSVEAFGAWMQVQAVTPTGLAQVRETVTCLAASEGLPAHAASIEARFAESASTHFAAVTPILLHANEFPFGPSARVQGALREAIVQSNRYPDPTQQRLRMALAHFAGVTPDRVIAGNGSDELLHLIGLELLAKGDEAMLCEPTFGVLRMETQRAGATVIDVPLDANYQIDPVALFAAITPRTKLVWLCSPNNPTGTPCDVSIVPELLARGLWVVVDEAYYPFGAATTIPLLADAQQLIITRTLSKIGALAGLRVGYALSNPDFIARLDARRQIYNVNTLAEVAACALLNDPDWFTAATARIIAERERLAAVLQALPGVHVWPSVANFLLVRFPVSDAAPLHAALAERGIAVRHFATDRLRDSLRISIGTTEENDYLGQVLSELLTPVPQEVQG